VSIDSALREAKRLKRERQARDQPPVIMIINNPEAVRLGFDLSSERMALIGTELFEAIELESTRAFHHRLVEIARSRRVFIVSVGSDVPQKVSLYNLDGTPVTVN
jgi:hypothetical protein